jgi:hypothetical protein
MRRLFLLLVLVALPAALLAAPASAAAGPLTVTKAKRLVLADWRADHGGRYAAACRRTGARSVTCTLTRRSGDGPACGQGTARRSRTGRTTVRTWIPAACRGAAPTPAPGAAVPAAPPAPSAPAAPAPAPPAPATPVPATAAGPDEGTVRRILTARFDAIHRETWMTGDELRVDLGPVQIGPVTQRQMFSGPLAVPLDVWPVLVDITITIRRGASTEVIKQGDHGTANFPAGETFFFYRDGGGAWTFSAVGQG